MTERNDNPNNAFEPNQDEQHAQTPQRNDRPQPSQAEVQYANAQLRSAQTLLTIAIISAPVSLIIGGVLLSLISLICALVGRSKINKAMGIIGPDGVAGNFSIQIRVALVVSIVALILNAISFFMMMGIIIDAMNSGNLNEVLNSIYSGNGFGNIANNGSGSGTGSGNTSIWG